MIRTYSRFPYRPIYGYVLLIAAVLLMSWENQRADAAIAGDSIPAQSIRLRILANSDSTLDQAVKREVRDAVVEEMKTWVAGPQTIEAARSTINAHMGDIEHIIAAKLKSRGFGYDYKAELGIVPFPTKIYGTQVYPAGNYEGAPYHPWRRRRTELVVRAVPSALLCGCCKRRSVNPCDNCSNSRDC